MMGGITRPCNRPPSAAADSPIRPFYGLVIDPLLPLKWVEFRRLRQHVSGVLGGSKHEFGFADESSLDDQDIGPVALGVTHDRLVVIKALGLVVGRPGETILDEPLTDLSFSWSWSAWGFRRVLLLSKSGMTMRMVFAPLWYQNVGRIRDATSR